MALTDRQAELAVKLVAKYNKQLNRLGIELDGIEQNPVFRMPTRQVDRTRRVTIKDGKILVTFPFDDSLITQLRAINSKYTSISSLYFDYADKNWVVPFSEPIILELNDIVVKANFELDQNFKLLVDKILDVKQQPYLIELNFDSFGNLYIEHAEESLVEYIENNCGGFNSSNLLKLVDLSSALGYSVSPKIVEELVAKYPSVNVNHLLLRENHVSDLKQVTEYCRLVDRQQVYVHTNNQLWLRSELINYYSSSEIANNIHYINKVGPNLDKIPTLITTEAMMAGIKRQHMLQIADKIFFYTKTVFHQLNT
jgi:hypothetical protein